MESFEQIANQYDQMIYKIIHSLHIYKDIDEYYQVGLIALWDASKSYDDSKGNFSSYAFKFIKGRILSELTKMTKYEERCQLLQQAWSGMPSDVLEQPLCETDLLLSYCDELTDHQKKWVVYAFREDLSVPEMAAREHVTVSAVKQWRKGAIEKLRKARNTSFGA